MQSGPNSGSLNSVSGRADSRWQVVSGEWRVASGECRENSSQSLAGIDGCRNSAFLILFYTFYGPFVQAMDTQLRAVYVRIGHVQPTAADSRVADHRSFPQQRSGLRSSRNWRALPDPRRAQYIRKTALTRCQHLLSRSDRFWPLELRVF